MALLLHPFTVRETESAPVFLDSLQQLLTLSIEGVIILLLYSIVIPLAYDYHAHLLAIYTGQALTIIGRFSAAGFFVRLIVLRWNG